MGGKKRGPLASSIRVVPNESDRPVVFKGPGLERGLAYRGAFEIVPSPGDGKVALINVLGVVQL